MIAFSLERNRTHGRSIYDKGVYPSDFDEEFKSSIRTRDKDRCAVCGRKRKARERELDVHHINYRKDTDRCNCISLCRACHTAVHEVRWDRDFWRNYLRGIALYREHKIKLSVEDRRLIVREMRKRIKVE